MKVRLGLRPYDDCLFVDIGDVPAVEELALSCQPGRFAATKMCFRLLSFRLRRETVP